VSIICLQFVSILVGHEIHDMYILKTVLFFKIFFVLLFFYYNSFSKIKMKALHCWMTERNRNQRGVEGVEDLV